MKQLPKMEYIVYRTWKDSGFSQILESFATRKEAVSYRAKYLRDDIKVHGHKNDKYEIHVRKLELRRNN